MVATTITAIATDWGPDPRIIRIVTLDDLAGITTAGYLTSAAVLADIADIQNGAFEFVADDYCLISYADGEGFFTVDFTTNAFVAAAVIPGSLSNTLASGHVFVGNGANIATGVAMTGIVAIDNTGATTIPLVSGDILVGSGGGLAAPVAMSGIVAITNAGVTSIPLTSGQLLVGSAGNVAASVAMSGSALISNTGVVTLPLTNTHILVGNAGGVGTDVAMSGDATIANTGAVTIAAGAVTSAKLDPTTIQYVKVPMTAANWAAMYAAPVIMIAAPGAGKMIVVKQAVIAMTFVSAQYTAGGVTALQYDSTVHGAGPLASDTVAAATINAYAATSDVGVQGADTSGASSAKVNKGLYMSNDTSAYATGDSTFNIHIWYSIVTLD